MSGSEPVVVDKREGKCGFMKKGKNKRFIIISILVIILDCTIDILVLNALKNRMDN